MTQKWSADFAQKEIARSSGVDRSRNPSHSAQRMATWILGLPFPFVMAGRKDFSPGLAVRT